jgi:hypothetical protein
MDWQKKVSLPKKVETCAFKEHKNAEDYICKSKGIYTRRKIRRSNLCDSLSKCFIWIMEQLVWAECI